MKKYRTVFCWISLCLTISAWAIYSLETSTSEHMQFEIGLIHLLLMSLVSFPTGPVMTSILAKFISFPSNYLDEVVFISFITIVAGSIQWLWLLPKLYRRYKKRTKG